MDNNKKILIRKNQNQNQYQTVQQAQNKIKQNERNPNLSESGTTTTASSVSSNTKNNHIYGNYKTPKKKNYQIPVKKNVKTVSPDFPNKTNKIYSKGVIKKFPQKKEILKIEMKIKKGGYTIVPLEIFLSRGYAKLEIALAKGKKLYDKHDDMVKKTQTRDIQRQMKR